MCIVRMTSSIRNSLKRLSSSASSVRKAALDSCKIVRLSCHYQVGDCGSAIFSGTPSQCFISGGVIGLYSARKLWSFETCRNCSTGLAELSFVGAASVTIKSPRSKRRRLRASGSAVSNLFGAARDRWIHCLVVRHW